MTDAAEHRQRARTFEQRENWKRAIESYENAIQEDENARKEVDLALFNRVGDLYRRIGDVNRAVHYYERAADGHLAAGFYNNAIALCNKILRNQPNRHSAYLKLGKIGAAKGFLSDARRHFLEYAERMQKANQVDKAFAALIEFADLSPDPEVRLMIADQLIENERTGSAIEQLRLAWRDLNQEGREADAEDIRQRILEMNPARDPEVDPPGEASSKNGLDAEGILDLPEILPWDSPEPEPRPDLPGPATVEAEELDSLMQEPGIDTLDAEPAVIENLDVDLIDTGGLETQLPEADPFVADPFEDQPLDALPDDALDFIPTAIVEVPEGDVDLEFEEPGGDPLDIVPTMLDEPVPLEPPVDIAEPPPAPPAPATPAERVADLESRLEGEGRQPQLLVELAEALLETGGREKATFCLGEAVELHEHQGQFHEAGRVLDELLRLNVNDVRVYQKRVELAFKASDRNALVDAYLGLADCLDRTDAGNKAHAVYARVLEIDPDNRRALAALEMFGEPEPLEPAASQTAGQDAEAFVDLGSLVEEAKAEKSTRFKIAAADPQSEADVNFAEMLSQFKSKVDENIEEEDSSSHYDLGVAFKEMGLIDEAIAEFQVAARGIDYRLRAIEMLGSCFLEKQSFRIALKVLSRALQVPEYNDEDLVGIFYTMGRSYEALGETPRAMEWYERVMGCDVNFKDVDNRMATLRQ
jgi:tetratricopeptide (TPR) repeat protein